ncbi:MAG: helix-turn-helix domain-containing protein [Leptospirillum sp.]
MVFEIDDQNLLIYTLGMKNNPVNISFGKKLAEKRKESGITQADLGRRVGLVRTTIANLEAGRQSVSLPLLYRIVQSLGNDLASFLPPIETGMENASVQDEDSVTGEISAREIGWAERVTHRPPEKKKKEKKT